MSEVVVIPFVMIAAHELINFIKKAFLYLYDKLDGLVFYRILVVKSNNPRNVRMFFEEIKARDLHKKGSTLQMSDGHQDPEFEIQNGTYSYEELNIGKIRINVSDEQVVAKLCKFPFMSKADMNKFIAYIKQLYAKHNSSAKLTLFFTSENDKWSNPIFRIPRNLGNLQLTDHMKEVMSDIDIFMNSRDKYMSEGHAYKRGYLLYGEPGTGKSTIVEMIANKYNMSVYMLTLNSNDMTDTILINLFCGIRPMSIIVLEEIDKQIETLGRNKTATVSIGGLLTAIDGPQRLADSTIVILTANKRMFLPPEDMNALLRLGRIDKTYQFTEML